MATAISMIQIIISNALGCVRSEPATTTKSIQYYFAILVGSINYTKHCLSLNQSDCLYVRSQQ